MKIVCVVRGYPAGHRPGGMFFVAQDRAHALAAMGHEIHVLTTGQNGHEFEAIDNGVEVHYLDCKSLTYTDEFATACREQCESIKPDVIHLDSLDVGRLWWADRPGGASKVAITLHGFCWGSALTKWNLYRLGQGPSPTFDFVGMMRERDALLQADTVIGISLHEHWMLQDLLGVPQAKLVYNPIAPYFFSRQLVDPPSKRRFLCAAISGHGERLFAVAKKAADKAGILLDVVSKTPRPLMPNLYDSYSALIVPTAYAQGFDLTVAEAMSRDRPVIVSATGSYFREACADSGISIVPMGDVDALAAAMERPMDSAHALSYAERHRPARHASEWLEAIGL